MMLINKPDEIILTTAKQCRPAQRFLLCEWSGRFSLHPGTRSGFDIPFFTEVDQREVACGASGNFQQWAGGAGMN